MPTGPDTDLHRSANQLLEAMIANWGRSLGVRVLGIKGFAAAYHGVREPRTSADVDVLVAMEDVGALRSFLVGVGWEERPPVPRFIEVEPHAATFTHPGWPCELDVHWRFPGMLAEPDRVFGALWCTRAEISIAGTVCVITGRLATILMVGLNSLRTPGYYSRHLDDYERSAALAAEMPEGDARALVALARTVGALDTARPMLALLPVALPSPTPRGSNRELDVWRAVSSSQGSLVVRVIGNALLAPPGARSGVLREFISASCRRGKEAQQTSRVIAPIGSRQSILVPEDIRRCRRALVAYRRARTDLPGSWSRAGREDADAGQLSA